MQQLPGQAIAVWQKCRTFAPAKALYPSASVLSHHLQKDTPPTAILDK
jgi:hypothetical protein